MEKLPQQELKRIFTEGVESELWRALVQVLGDEQNDIEEKIFDIDSVDERARVNLVIQRNFLKWVLEIPERVQEKPVNATPETGDPYDKSPNNGNN